MTPGWKSWECRCLQAGYQLVGVFVRRRVWAFLIVVDSKRPCLTACLEYVREGDVLVVTKLDRLARSTLDLCQIPVSIWLRQAWLTMSTPTGYVLVGDMQKAPYLSAIPTHRTVGEIVGYNVWMSIEVRQF